MIKTIIHIFSSFEQTPGLQRLIRRMCSACFNVLVLMVDIEYCWYFRVHLSVCVVDNLVWSLSSIIAVGFLSRTGRGS